jgi:outer membrane biosynthesis protein TonB
MPTTEVPNPAKRPPPKEREQGHAPLLAGAKAKSKYGSMETHELLTLVEDLEDDRTRARVREGIWVSVIAHLLLFWFIAYGPQVIFHHPRVINPADILAQRDKDQQFIDLPPDALEHLKPKPTNRISDKDRVAETPHPTLDKKTLAELEAMKPKGPPAPAPQQPAQQQAQASPQPHAQQPGQPQQAKEVPVPQPQAPQPQASLETPQAPSKPSFKTGGSIGDQIRRDAQAAARGSAGAGDFGAGAPLHHNGNLGGMEILSDTMGVDFGPYMARLKYLIEHTWWPLIPEEAMPPLSKKGLTLVRFKIGPDGTLMEMHLDGGSGTTSLDRAAWGAVKGSQPLPALPKSFKGPYLEIRGGFFYNLSPEDMK